MTATQPHRAMLVAMFALSFSLVFFELLLTRLFGVVLFAQFAHLALALALLGISLGAIAQHLWPSLVPAEDIEKRMSWLVLGQGLATLIAVICTIEFPVTVQFDTTVNTYSERSFVKDDLLDPWWFAALLPVLCLPFTIAGLAFAGAFQRLKPHIGKLYGADLIGGAFGSVVFLPTLTLLSGPDSVFLLTLSSAAAALLLARASAQRTVAGLSIAVLGASVIAMAVGSSRVAVLEVKYAAGYTESKVIENFWTPLTRLSIYENRDEAFILLDNSSTSQIFLNEAQRKRVDRIANRSFVWNIHEPPGRVAVLAASAGPEVAVAQSYGFTDIDAIDIAGEIFDIVADRYATSPVNPYVSPSTRRIKADGRSAILHAKEPYDVIQMVHANLWSSAGLLANAWSPSLLETVEAFETYLAALTPDGTLSFGRGSATDPILRSAATALERRGVSEPWRHIAYVKGSSTVLLVKPRPFTAEERDALDQAIGTYRKLAWVIDPLAEPDKAVKKLLAGPILTDDRPYLDSPALVSRHVSNAFRLVSGEKEKPLATLYRSVVIQCGFALGAGLIFIGLPLLLRGSRETAALRGAWAGLGYVCCLGYGYLAVEVVLIHQLALFVGHPTYAVTIVILGMLLASGVGSLIADRLPADKLESSLRKSLMAVLGLGLLAAFVLPEILHATALGLPLTVRLGLTFISLLPLGLVMGMPFPLGIRLLRGEVSSLVPWCWALNGWTSVVASLSTVLLSRMWGYTTAFTVALASYLLALLLVGLLPKIRRDVT